MDDFMEAPSPREKQDKSNLATRQRHQDRVRGCVEKHEIHRRLGEHKTHESEPLKNA